MSQVEEQVNADKPVNIASKDSDERLQSTNNQAIMQTIKNYSKTNTLPVSEQSITEIKTVTSSDRSSKIIESEASDIKIGRTTPKTSRELKSILALSKEAKLDTNIVHKRKSIEPSKLNESAQPQRRNSTGSTSSNRDDGKKLTDWYTGLLARKMQFNL